MKKKFVLSFLVTTKKKNIKCYKQQILKKVDKIIIVDDRCPQNTGKFLKKNKTKQKN